MESEITKMQIPSFSQMNSNSSKASYSDHVQKLTKNKQVIVNFLRRTDKMLSLLFAKKVLTSQEYHNLQDHSTPHELASHLLDVLTNKELSAYQWFLKCLDETNQHHLCCVLEEEAYQLNDDHSSIIVDNFIYLKENITISGSNILDTLMIEKVLDEQEVDEIQSKLTERNKAEHLLRIILRTSPEQYQLFLQSLASADHKFVYDKLCGIVVLSDENEEVVNDNMLSDKPADIRMMMGHGFVVDLTVVDSNIFVVRDRPTQGVNVYDSISLTLRRNIAIPGSKRLWAIIACSRNKCLYVSDYELKVIYRYDFSKNIIRNNWSLTGICTGLSLTSCYNVLANLWDINRIQEYNPDGCLIKEIILDKNIDRPQHCIETLTGKFIISYGDMTTQKHGVCYVNASGNVIQTYGGDKGSEVGQVNAPCHMSITKNDQVLIADCFNSRVELLTPTLRHVCYISIPGYSLYGPYTVHLDQLNHRLYVGEWAGGRLFSVNSNVLEDAIHL